MRSQKAISFLLGTVSVLTAIALWQLAATLKLSSTVPIPSVPATFARGVVMRTEIMSDLGRTLGRAFGGYALAGVTMIPLGLLIGRSPFWAKCLNPIIETLRPLPTPAIIPLVMLLAGIGDAAKIGIVFFGAAFPILLNTADSVRGLHPMVALSARSLRLSRLEAFALVYVPAALPQILAGCRISLSLALLIAVTAEMLLSTDGLGVFLSRAQESFLISDLIAGLLVLASAAFLLNRLFVMFEARVLFWHHARTS